MNPDGSITRWICELELGRADEAQEQIWLRYFGRLIGLAKLKLGESPRTVADEEDVATAALQSFFAGVTKGRFPRLHDRHDLWPLLAKITSHKALDQQRYLLAEKRGAGKVQDDCTACVSSGAVAQWSANIIDDEIGPEHLALLREQCERLMNLLGDDQLRKIARRRLEGYSNRDIANELSVIERTVERRLRLIRELWKNDLPEHGTS